MALSLQIREILALHRRQLFGLVEQRGVARMRRMYEESRAELRDRLARLERDGKGQTFSAHHLRTVLAQVEEAVSGFQANLAVHLGQQGRVAAHLAPRHLVDAVERLHQHFGAHTPLIGSAQAAVFQRVFPGVAPSLMNRFQQSARLYGPQAIANMREQLSRSILQGQGVDEAVRRVTDSTGLFEGQRWRAERIVRTELSYAYGVAKQRGMEELRQRVPKLKKRLVATFDDRTGDDSKELHGQTVDIDKPFVWHVKDRHGRVKKTVLYMQPPNRPNDREVVIPWVEGWPEPGRPGGVQPTTQGLPGG